MVWLRDLQRFQFNHLSPALPGYAAARLDSATHRPFARRRLPRSGYGANQSLVDCWFSRLSHIAPVGDAAFWRVQLKAGRSARNGGDVDLYYLTGLYAPASATGDINGDDMSTTSDTPPIVIATLLHEQGTTCVHSHFNAFREYLHSRVQPIFVVTPYHTKRALAYPIYGVCFSFVCFLGLVSVWWYIFLFF